MTRETPFSSILAADDPAHAISLPEVAGDSADFVDPTGTEWIVDGLLVALARDAR